MDYTNIHSFVEVLDVPEDGLPKRKRKELAKEQKNPETERKHESGFVIHSTSGESAAGLRKQTDAGVIFSDRPSFT